MKRFLAARSILLCILSLIDFFFVGVGFAIATDAGKGMGMFGAIVLLTYGAASGLLALILAIFLVRNLEEKAVTRLNVMLLILFLLFSSYFVVYA